MSMSDYRSANPFFTEEDDDDFGFGKAPARAAGRDEWADFGEAERPLSRDEQIQQMKENSQNRQLESTQKALSSMYESERMGVDTAEELVRQGEQLDNVERKLDTMDGDLKTSQRHLNNIKSVFGGIRNWWSGKKEIKEEPEKASGEANSARLQAALERDRVENEGSQHPALRLRSEDGKGFYTDDTDGGYSAGASGGYGGASGSSYSSGGYSKKTTSSSKPSGHEEQLDANIDLMSSGMSRLKGLALGLGDEIERQNVQIDRIAPKTDALESTIKDKNQQMRGILGK